jgi:hypothetical protein
MWPLHCIHGAPRGAWVDEGRSCTVAGIAEPCKRLSIRVGVLDCVRKSQYVVRAAICGKSTGSQLAATDEDAESRLGRYKNTSRPDLRLGAMDNNK